MGVIGTIKGVNVIEQHIREYERKLLMSLHQARFALSAELNWNRNHATTHKHLLQLKKPILPERWRGHREGWGQWAELLINPGITIKGLPDLQSEPLTDKMIYDAIEKLGENWRLK